jgi:Glycosyltransferase family 87
VSDSLRKAVAWVACGASIAVFAIRVVIPAAADPYTNGFATCYAESRILLENPRELRHVYEDEWFQRRVDRALGRHLVEIAQGQPPTMSLILAPVAWMSPARARIAWIWLSVLFWFAGIAVLARALALGSLGGVPPPVWLVAAATFYRPISENLARGQGYALLFFLLSLAVRGLVVACHRGPRAATGIPLGLMPVLKSSGLWLYPLLIAARQWRILAGTGLTIASVGLVSAALMGWRIWPLYVKETLHWIATEPSNRVTAYQTVQSLTGHLFVYDATWNPGPILHAPALGKLLATVVLGSIFAVSARRQRLDSPDLQTRALTVGMFVAPMPATAPIGEGYHYVLAFPAVVIGFWWASRTPRPANACCVAALATALMCVPQWCYGARALRDGWTALLAYPRVYGAFTLWGLLAYALGPRRATADPEPRHSG